MKNRMTLEMYAGQAMRTDMLGAILKDVLELLTVPMRTITYRFFAINPD